MLLHLKVGSGYFMAFYALWGLALLLVWSRSEAGRFNWASIALLVSANLLLALSAAGAVIQSISRLSLENRALNQLIVTLLVITAVGALSSVLSKGASLRGAYRRATFVMAAFTYTLIGIRLGYHMMWQTEFYSIPVGAALLVAGYWGVRRLGDKTGVLWLWAGSLLWALPLLLHTLRYRFIVHESSIWHDIGLLLFSLILILGGIVLQLKAPTIVGGASFIIGLSAIVFGFVEWEQKWLSISMIMLALVIFISS